MTRVPTFPRSVRKLPGALAALVIVAGTAGVPLTVATATPAGASPPATDSTGYVVGTPQLATITGNGSSLAPWNTSQGDSSSAAYPESDLLPTFVPGGSTTAIGGVTEPNVAVNPGSGSVPYASGVVGSPGPLEAYCGSGSNTTEDSGTPSRQPAGTTLPMSPYYFPHVVRNSDGSLTGYFDWRPKDADEAIVTARSTDNGKDWTYEGEALEQNPAYCPNADINDDGQGHPQVLTIGGTTYLYTLQRAAGDNTDVPLLVHAVDPTAANPLAAVPATEKVGLDPDSFTTATDAVTHGTSSTITVQATHSADLTNGGAGSPDELVPGPFVDLTQTPTPTAASIITCTGVTATSLTGCTTPSGTTVTVAAGDLIEQVIAKVSTAHPIPAGPNTPAGTGGVTSVTMAPVDALSMTIFNNNAPNRAYVDGVAVYCSQANANPTTKIEDCTTGEGGPTVNDAVGDPLTLDPVVPATAQTTNGLVSPDGIVGVLPTYPGVPSGATTVMYTEKVLGYFVAGVTTNGSTSTYGSVVSGSPTSSTFTLAFNPSASESSDLPPTISSGSPVTLEMGDGTKGSIIPVTCTGLATTTAGSPGTAAVLTFSGCTVASADAGDTLPATAMVGTAGAATTAESVLAQTGEGSTKTTAAAKLFGNNEDLEVLRVAYTTDGINFSSAGLDDDGVISGQSNGDPSAFDPSSATSDNFTGSDYQDLTNPEQTTSPSNLNAYAASGTEDASEMRWVGSTGTIITNPDGSIGLFLNGSFAADGDSDAFNQVFYSTSTDGEHWTTPVSVVSTDYTFADSVAQDNALAAGQDTPLGIHAYYSGRAYNPTIVPNGDGTLTMLFSGYRTPGSAKVGSIPIGTDASAQYTPDAVDPLLYRNILVTTLTPESGDPATTATSLSASPGTPTVGQSVTYTATVTTAGPGDPTGTVAFSDGSGTLCGASALSVSTPDTASCTTVYDGTAVTAAFSGDADNASSTSTLEFAPGAPTGVTATAGSGSAIVSWSAPSTTGGAPVTGYTVTASGDGGDQTCTSATTSCTVTGLTNGTAYTFAVSATTSAGTGPVSTTSGAVTPSGSPDAPTDVTATAGAGQAIVSWTPGGSEGAGVLSYTVTGQSSGAPTEQCTYTVAVPEVNLCTVTGLTNGASYTFTVAATNADGTGAASAPSAAVTPSTVPDAPSGVTGTGGDANATVSWSAADAEGSPVTGYTVVAAGDGGGETCTTPDGSTTSCVVTGLTNGTDYTFSVTATNANGTGAASASSSPVTPTSVPDAPTGVVATAAAGSASVSWTDGGDEGSPVTGYTITAAGDGTDETCSTSTTSCDVTGLTNGIPYTFTVVASNIDGASAPSMASSPVTPTASPDAPTDVQATSGAGSAVISWSAPSDEGSPITGYTVTSSGGQTCATPDGSTTTCTVTGLDNGTAYTFTVMATNAVGTGDASAPSGSVAPSAAPDAPTGVVAAPADHGATITWAAPFDEGAPITGYTVTADTGQTCSTPDGSTTTCGVSGLTNGTAYTFTVTAANVDGTSTASTASAQVVPTTTPDAPTSVVATAGRGSAVVSWTAPSDEGSPITGYTVTSSGGQTCAAASTSCTVTGLANGTAYTFTVTAVNAQGTGLASAPSTTVTPSTVPDAPTGVVATAGNGAATVSWTAPSDEGSPVTGYTVTASNSNPPKTCTTSGATTCSISGLANGAAYSFTVRATNANGTGAASSPSSTISPTSNTAVITSADSATVAHGKSVHVTVTASGTPPPSYSASGLPNGLILKSASDGKAILEGAPVTGDGIYTFTLMADNGSGPGDNQTFTLTVFGITTGSTASFTVGVHGSFAIATAPAQAGTTVSVKIPRKLKGLSLTTGPDGTAQLSGSPASGDASSLVTVQASEGTITVTQKLQVTITG